MKEGTYKVTALEYEFIMTVERYKNLYTIRYGDALNHEGPCIEFTYDTKKPSILKLDNLEYRSECSANKELLRGQGTINMTKSILLLLCSQFSDIKRITLNDVAVIECGKRKLPLIYMYLLKYGVTWYQKYFQAKCVNKELAKRIEQVNDELAGNVPKLFSFKNTENTWFEFFQKQDCDFFIDNMNELKRYIKAPLMYSEWYISRKNIVKYEIPIKVHKGGAYVPNWKITRAHLV
jgi:hypothetical protein